MDRSPASRRNRAAAPRLDTVLGRSSSDSPPDGVESSFELNVLERRKDTQVVNLEGRIRVLDTRTGRVSAGWP